MQTFRNRTKRKEPTMAKRLTSSSLVAQMVLDAIANDDRREEGKTPLGDVLERARLWFDRAKTLVGLKRFYYDNLVQYGFDKFLCSQESNLGILDFWDGDVVEFRSDSGVVKTGVVKYVSVKASIHGGGGAIVMFPDGVEKHCGWENLYHAKIPQAILDIAKAQIVASGKCPFSK